MSSSAGCFKGSTIVSSTARHCGHERPSGASFVDCSRHTRQKLCWHFSVRGSKKKSRQMEHCRSGSSAAASNEVAS
eukprot:2442278-Prymnesium_polylepis.1